MHYFLLPLIPLTLMGALFFKKGLKAYGLALALTAVKMFTTRISLIYLFVGLSLTALVYAVRRIHKNSKISLPAAAFFYAVLGVFLFELITNFGAWLMGACLGNEGRLYAFTLPGLVDSYRAALPHSLIHVAKAVPLTLLFVPVIQRLKDRNPVSSFNKARGSPVPVSGA